MGAQSDAEKVQLLPPYSSGAGTIIRCRLFTALAIQTRSRCVYGNAQQQCSMPACASRHLGNLLAFHHTRLG
jgi:hypothetical protein